jgi:hypothetical protein
MIEGAYILKELHQCFTQLLISIIYFITFTNIKKLARTYVGKNNIT